jgi:spore coat polysaccharide biosynthesis protein SpsF
MKTTIIIQARMGSTRLPGKVLQPICGRTMLERVCRRASRSFLADELLVATSTSPKDDAVVAECRRIGVACYRGNEDDVLDRYYLAALAQRTEAVVRVTADCPLIDDHVIDKIILAMLQSGPDYASNVIQRTYPRGLDAEVFTVDALERAWREAQLPYERIHVTPYFYRHPELFRLHSVVGSEELGDWRWTVDSPDDLAFVRAVYERFDGDDEFTWHDVRRLLLAEPWLADLNDHVQQKHLVEG